MQKAESSNHNKNQRIQQNHGSERAREKSLRKKGQRSTSGKLTRGKINIISFLFLFLVLLMSRGKTATDKPGTPKICRLDWIRCFRYRILKKGFLYVFVRVLGFFAEKSCECAELKTTRSLSGLSLSLPVGGGI